MWNFYWKNLWFLWSTIWWILQYFSVTDQKLYISFYNNIIDEIRDFFFSAPDRRNQDFFPTMDWQNLKFFFQWQSKDILDFFYVSDMKFVILFWDRFTKFAITFCLSKKNTCNAAYLEGREKNSLFLSLIDIVLNWWK